VECEGKDCDGVPDRRLALLLPSAFLTSLGIGVVNLGMLFVVKEGYGAGPAIVGWFAALWAMAYFAGCILLRPLARVLPAHASMAIMNLASAGLFAAHLALPGLVSAFLIYGLYGLATALFWPRLMGWLASGLEGPALSRASGAFSLSWSAGGVISPFLAGVLSEREIFLPVYVGAAVFAFAGLFLLAGRRIAPSPPLAAATSSRDAADRSTSLRYPAWIGVFLVYAFISVFFTIFPLFAKDELGLPESSIGFILLLRAASSAFGFWLFGRLSYWHFKPGHIALAVLAALALDIVLIAARSPVAIALCLVLGGLVLADIYGKSIFYGSSGARDLDARMTVHEALLTAGQIVGSIVGGLVYQTVSWSAVFVVLAAIMAAGLGAQVYLLRRRP
jgi:DHA1 family inner membrane transport protein